MEDIPPDSEKWICPYCLAEGLGQQNTVRADVGSGRCFCGELAGSDRSIICDHMSCENDIFHLKCLGLPETFVQPQPWFCPECSGREVAEDFAGF